MRSITINDYIYGLITIQLMSITLIIIVITSLVSITTFTRPGDMEKLSFWPYQVNHRNQYYRFFTSGLVHRDFMHLFFNMLSLYFFGDYISFYFERVLGSVYYFPLLYVLGLVLPDVANYFKYKDVYGYQSIGASGAVSAVLFSCVLFDPWQKIGLYFFIPMWFILYAVLYLVYSAYMSRRGGDGIDHSAHFWGAVLGLVFPIVIKPAVFTYFLQRLLNP
ncbi:rhomboid family intramembrane serine protease [Chitinophaga caseinilytica]|uniref:Rhomboid family intramembrane serine protease n=1 Tax=Chitinophaga caseinilytica TaxID=2267521 RepID=A0ABZ2YZN9_9BACT